MLRFLILDQWKYSFHDELSVSMFPLNKVLHDYSTELASTIILKC